MSGWHFDAYCATFHELPVEAVRGALLSELDLTSWVSTRGKNGYSMGGKLTRNPHDKGGHALCDVWWSEDAAMGVHVHCQGSESADVAQAVRNMPKAHRVTRADVRLDVIEEGLFDRLHATLIPFAKQRRMRVGYQGDWANNVERTFYVGSRESSYMLRIYEKGQKEKSNPHWVRIELEVKPKGKQGYVCNQWTPEEFLGASAWVRDALALIGIDALQTQSLGTVWRPSDKDRARAAMLRQYGAILREWAAQSPTLEHFAVDLLRSVDESEKPLHARVEHFDVPF